MSLTTKQRLTRAKKLTLPQIVQPQNKCETSHHKVPHLVKVTLQSSPYFQLAASNDWGGHHKVPLGLYTTVRILFTPGQNKDYFHQLLCTTEREECQFIVPIWAIGAQAILDFPDQLDFSECPVKCSTQKTAGFGRLFATLDYFHQLLCTTEREECQFIVPIWAIGAQAILDFPDQLDFSECPVKCSTQKTAGFGRLFATLWLVFSLLTQVSRSELDCKSDNIPASPPRDLISQCCSPFTVILAMVTLGVSNTMQVTVGFQPLKTGVHSMSLVMHYDTDEDTHTSLHGRPVDVPISLDRNTVTVEKTYTILSNAQLCSSNLSDIIARFQWKAADTRRGGSAEAEIWCRDSDSEEAAKTCNPGGYPR
ncbi:hypothetical protein HGM15179_014098 [Zosterops borbonicus]|uniref:HYDIN/VesB/CFA65-like Ig-like domain-containing protein n=1 Tax=Zosterops borbonicus TaxID=364589 RepID=A0A8K1G7J7_9PASS|nr:hypothetical protein HGM15179_014098 [Zosterops borbonicus]